MTNLPDARSILGWSDGYHPICREERNVAAIFYHLLLQGSNLRRFLELLGCSLPVLPSETAIYFEYAYARDLWHARVRDPATARSLIISLLAPPNAADLMQMSIKDFNTFFGATPRPSRDCIQMPGKWSLERFAPNIVDSDAFLRTCRFKWAFNAKPDIVIHLSHDTCVCVEAKVESSEGQYPNKAAEKREFERRGLPRQAQTDLQNYMMTDVLGLNTQFVFLIASRSAGSATHRTVRWHEAFAVLDRTGCLPFIDSMVARLSP